MLNTVGGVLGSMRSHWTARVPPPPPRPPCSDIFYDICMHAYIINIARYKYDAIGGRYCHPYLLQHVSQTMAHLVHPTLCAASMRADADCRCVGPKAAVACVHIPNHRTSIHEAPSSSFPLINSTPLHVGRPRVSFPKMILITYA